jgi:hypothetical protein
VSPLEADIAGSSGPEAAAIFLCESDADVHFYRHGENGIEVLAVGFDGLSIETA